MKHFPPEIRTESEYIARCTDGYFNGLTSLVPDSLRAGYIALARKSHAHYAITRVYQEQVGD